MSDLVGTQIVGFLTQRLICVFSQERQYKQISSVDQLAIHFALDGNMLHKESDEAKRQRARLGLPEGG